MEIVVEDATAQYGNRGTMLRVFRADHYAEFKAGKRVKTGPVELPHLVSVASISGAGSAGVQLQATAGMGARSKGFATVEAALSHLRSIEL